MLGFLVRRSLSAIPVMAIVATIVFFMLRLAPGDPAAILAGDVATPEQIEEIRQNLGLDQPLVFQFITWIGHLVQGDLGVSILSRQPVSQLIADRLEPTLSLATTTMGFAMLVAIPLGVLAAWRRGSLIDRAVMSFAVLGFSVPVFVVGYLWIFLLSMTWPIFRVQGFVSITEGILPFFQSIALPTLALAGGYIALIARVTRASMLEVLGEDYVRTAHAKGVGKLSVLSRHALPNTAIPIASVVGNGIALLIGGVVVTESVFNLPGLGRLTVDAVLARDYPVIQAIILLLSGICVLINLLIDLSYPLFDPRVRP